MIARRRCARSAAAVGLLTVLAGTVSACAASHELTAPPSPPAKVASLAAPASSAAATRSSSASPPPRVPVPMNDLGTTPVGDGFAAAAVSQGYVIRPDPADQDGVEVVRRSDGKVILHHRPADVTRFEITYVALSGDFAVISDEDTSDDDSMTADYGAHHAITWIIDLATGKQTKLSTIPSAPTASPFTAEAVLDADGTWYYDANSPGHSTNCVAALDLHTLQGRMIHCAAGDGQIYFVEPGDGGATWMERPHPEVVVDCETAGGISDGATYQIAPGDCNVFEVGMIDGWNIWDDTDQTNGGGDIPLQASDGITTIPLGNAESLSLITCGGYAYWKSDEVAFPRIARGTLLRWRPGWSGPQVVLAPAAVTGSDVSDEILYPEGCNDDILTVTVDRYFGASDNYTVQVLAIPPAPSPSGAATP